MKTRMAKVLCAKCGEPSKGKRFCDRCVEVRLGVIVQREHLDRSTSTGWRDLGHGGYMRRRPAFC
jgi:hypothetical protein